MLEEVYNEYWKKVDSEVMSKKFDDLWNFLPEVESILDIGGGNGALKTSLDRNRPGNKTAYSVVDCSEEAVKQVEMVGGVGILHDLDTPLDSIKDNSYELVILADVLEHVTNPWAILREASRVSSKYVLVRGPNFASLACRWDLLRGRPIREMVAAKDGSLYKNGIKCSHIYFITYNNLILWGTRAGLVVDKKRVFWFRRYAPFRIVLETFFSNWGARYDVLFEKKGEVADINDPNLNFYTVN